MEEQKTNKGITIIALIITIIILLIIAVITVQTINGDGLLGKTREARFKAEIAQLKEYIMIQRQEKKDMKKR